MTQIIDAPAPWSLTGRAYISLIRLPEAQLEQHCFVPASLTGKRRSGLSLMMFVDYANSPAGPYYELLFIPARYLFEDGRERFTISRIFVSTLDSVVNGQRNWGIPKDTADFDVSYGADGRTQVRVSKDGKVFADMNYRHRGPALPVPRGLLPRALRTLAQHWKEKTFVYRPNSGGWAKFAGIESMQFDAQQFPDLNAGKTLTTIHLSSFNMTFPVAEITTRK